MPADSGNTVRSGITYEGHLLDEVATILTEEYGKSDETAIRMVMRAQADDFFTGHDDDPSICTVERAHQDAEIIFRKYS